MQWVRVQRSDLRRPPWVQAPRQICTSDGVQAVTSGPAAYLGASRPISWNGSA